MSTPYHTHTGAAPNGGTYYNRGTYALAPGSAAAFGGVGAFMGAVGATAVCLPRVRGKQMTGSEAVLVVAKEAAGMGLATAAGGVVARSTGLGGLAGLLGMFAVATGVKYFWNQAMDRRGDQAGKAEKQETAQEQPA